MNISFVDDVQIFPQQTLTIDKTLHQMRHNIIFHIDNPKQDLNNISFLQIFSFVIEFFLESCPHLIPIVFKFESKVLFPNINEFSYLIDGNLKNSICISSILRFLGLSTSMLLL